MPLPSSSRFGTLHLLLSLFRSYLGHVLFRPHPTPRPVTFSQSSGSAGLSTSGGREGPGRGGRNPICQREG